MNKIITFIVAVAIVSVLQAKDHIVDQVGKKFIPNHVNAKVGDKIIFQNHDSFAHNAYSDNPGNEFDIGMQKPGQDIAVEMKAPGKVEVGCAIHPSMQLIINVK
jgi:plastocyanin